MRKNFTRIPNELLEFISQSRSFCEKTRVICVILRKTYGWGKSSDYISLSQFEEFTGMRRPNICRALKKLVKSELISKDGNRYRIDEEKIIQMDNEDYQIR